jgi:sigma-B regulation protein RsbU (phosphoserine phosphatase)
MNAPKKILLLESEFVTRQAMLNYLEEQKFVVIEAADFATANACLEKQPVDIVIMACNATDANVAQEMEGLLQKTQAKNNIPVIVLAIIELIDTVLVALRAGAWDYVPKPVTDLEVLQHAVQRVLEKQRLMLENQQYAERLANNLRILEEDQVAGRTVQMSLLPGNNMQFVAYTISYSVNPSLYLSGDFLEYFYITETKVGIYLADVSGHGASSAFVTILLKSLVANCLARLQVHGDKTILHPERLLEELSYEIHTAKLGKYMTMFYCMLDLETHSLVYSIGGHYPNPMQLRAQGSSYLPGSGYPVGIMSSATYKVFETSLNAGEKLVCCSDGVMEIFLPGKSMEEKDPGLLALVVENNGEVERMKQALNIQDTDDHRPDDISFLCIHRT